MASMRLGALERQLGLPEGNLIYRQVSNQVPKTTSDVASIVASVSDSLRVTEVYTPENHLHESGGINLEINCFYISCIDGIAKVSVQTRKPETLIDNGKPPSYKNLNASSILFEYPS